MFIDRDQTGRSRLARNIEKLPLEIRLMIYDELHLPLDNTYRDHISGLASKSETRFIYAHSRASRRKKGQIFNTIPPVLWLSPSISSETRVSDRLFFSLKVFGQFTRPVIDQCLASAPLAWLRAGLGEVLHVDIKGIGIQPIDLHVCPNAFDCVAPHTTTLMVHANPLLSGFLKWPSVKCQPEFEWLRHLYGKKRVASVQKEFTEQLARDIRQSISARDGYGLALVEMQLIIDAVWALSQGFEHAEKGFKALKRQAQLKDAGARKKGQVPGTVAKYGKL